MRRRQQPLSGCAALPNRQRGAVMILFVIGMVAILGIAGLALDGGHMMLSKTRLQNTVDAAALSAAKTLAVTENDEVLARAAALAMFADNAAGNGNRELNEAYTSGSLNVTVEFSNTLTPFVPGSSPADYVRVRGLNFTLPVWFSTVLGITEKGVAASAVAGPSPTIKIEACNLLPMMVCGDPTKPNDYWGFEPGEPMVLKSAPQDPTEVGTGDFQLIRLGENSGANDVRNALAGGYDGCLASDDIIETEPGNSPMPVAQGLNTRFGSYIGPLAGTQSMYPPDVVTAQPTTALEYSDDGVILQDGLPLSDANPLSYGWDDYKADLAAHNYNYQPSPIGVGRFKRREAAIAIGDCSDPANGQDQLPLLGFGCYFLLQEVRTNGPHLGTESQVFGQFLDDCNIGGVPGAEPNDESGPFRIQLYRDYASTDS